jgi:hypothetical protein
LGPIGRLDDLNWKVRHEAKLRETSFRPVRLLLLSDSITANYELKVFNPLQNYSFVRQRYTRTDMHSISASAAMELVIRVAHYER